MAETTTHARDESQTETTTTTTTTIPVVVETATVGKRVVETGRATIHKSVSERDEVVEALLARHDVEITRVPVNRVVAEAPAPRREGANWVWPILEEVLVVEKRLVLKEELHIRTTTTQEAVQETVRLRSESVAIDTSPASEPDTAANPPAAT